MSRLMDFYPCEASLTQRREVSLSLCTGGGTGPGPHLGDLSVFCRQNTVILAANGVFLRDG